MQEQTCNKASEEHNYRTKICRQIWLASPSSEEGLALLGEAEATVRWPGAPKHPVG